MTIRIGILVAYMVSEPQGKLLELHLDRIARHTTVPYRIHGCANRLPPQFIHTLRQHPAVTLYDLPATDLRGAREHSYYLEQLVRLAIHAGASHLVILHVDSFPVRDGWVESLVARLSDACAFVTIENINTACLLFHRDFFLRYHPALLVSTTDQESAEFKEYMRTIKPLLHSGTGFGFTAYREGLRWSYMRRSSLVETAPHCPAIFDDLVFHLGGAVRLSEVPSRSVPGLLRRIGYRRLEAFVAAMRALTPTTIKDLLRATFGRQVASIFDHPRTQWKAQAMASACEQLLADPVSYLDRLRVRGA